MTTQTQSLEPRTGEWSAAPAKLSVGRTAAVGALFGLVASLVMAVYAMLASATSHGRGFFTPLYHIASVVVDPDALAESMRQASGGNLFYFAASPAFLGAAIHMATGAGFGALFGVAIGLLRLRGGAVVAAGAAWGAIVFAFSTWIGLSVTATLLGSGDQIANMAAAVGYGTFLIEHALFGVVVGLLMAGRTHHWSVATVGP